MRAFACAPESVRLLLQDQQTRTSRRGPMTRTCGRSASAAAVALLVAATSFTGFRSISSFCIDPSHGAEFDAVGHLVEGLTVDTYVAYTVKGCDNGPAGFGVDTWRIDIPSRSYHKDGFVTGDIQKQ